jgi:2-oxoglutarate dehydrogenase E1 component
MGYWTFVEPNIEFVLGKVGGAAQRPRYVGRAPTASTATGIASKHKQQQDALVDEALS